MAKRSVVHDKLEYYPYDKYKSPHTETHTSNFFGGVGGGGYSGVKYSKCQDLPKFQFLGPRSA